MKHINIYKGTLNIHEWRFIMLSFKSIKHFLRKNTILFNFLLVYTVLFSQFKSMNLIMQIATIMGFVSSIIFVYLHIQHNE